MFKLEEVGDNWKTPIHILLDSPKDSQRTLEHTHIHIRINGQ